MEISKRKIKEIFDLILKNKIKFSIIVFLIWITFFDQNSVIKIIGYYSDISELKSQKVFLNEIIKKDSIKLYELKTNDYLLEKFAREQYRMHKPNEEVIVIEYEKN